MRLVFVKHRQRVRAPQLRGGLFERIKQVAVVQTVDQVRDDLGVGLALKNIAARLERSAQFVMVFDDAVVHQRHPPRRIGGSACAVAEMRVCVVHHRRAVRGPARVGNARAALHGPAADLLHQLGNTRRAARALQATALRAQATGMHRHAARVIAPVLQPLKPLHEDRDDIAGGNPADDAAHSFSLD